MATYTVQRGETLSSIARKLNVPLGAISGYRSGNPNLIYPGEQLTINRPGATTQQPAQLDQLDILRQIAVNLADQIEELNKKNLAINPNVPITPEMMLQFTREAEAELEPYFASQLRLATEALQANWAYRREEILAQEKDLERFYGRTLKTQAEELAELGFSGGRRLLAEKQLAEDVQSKVEAGRRNIAFGLGQQYRDFVRQYGPGGISLPAEVAQAPLVVPGQSTFRQGERTLDFSPYYQLSPRVTEGLIGEQERRKRVAIAEEAALKRQLFRESEAAKQYQALLKEKKGEELPRKFQL